LGELNTLSVSVRRLVEQTERDPRGLIFGHKPVPPGPGESATAP
jgi:phospholipid/cholesterol/gamma-HCH transport system substrate-binding protein